MDAHIAIPHIAHRNGELIMRILAIDPGSKHLGVAISDPTGTLARPLEVIRHTSRMEDSQRIAALAAEHQAELILIGQSLDEEGIPTLEGRRAARLAKAIQSLTPIPVLLWDESFSTSTARQARIAQGVPKKKRRVHLDDAAAAIILQSYLDTLADQNSLVDNQGTNRDQI
jgi:putative Holliday junction resolvase